MPKEKSEAYSFVYERALKRLRDGQGLDGWIPKLNGRPAQQATINRAKRAAKVRYIANTNAEKLRKMWELKRVDLASPELESPDNSVGSVGARVFEHFCDNGDGGALVRTVVLGSGGTVHSLVSNLKVTDRKVCLAPASLSMTNALSSDAVANVLLLHWRSNNKTIPVPGCVPPLAKDECDHFKTFRELEINRQAFQRAKMADILVIGIGDMVAANNPALSMFESLGFDQKEHLNPYRGVAEVNFSILDTEGRDVTSQTFGESDANSREWKGSHPLFPALDIGEIRRIADEEHAVVIGVAQGKRKARAIHAALKAKLINCLVTDVDTASRLVELKEEDEHQGKVRHHSGASPTRQRTDRVES